MPPSLSVCSCLSSDMSEWRSLPLQEVLPLSARLHRSTLPVSAHADAAGPGCPGQQAARLPNVPEAGQPAICGGNEHRAHADDPNALGLHAALIAGTPLARRYRWSSPGFAAGRRETNMGVCFQCRSTCACTTRRTPRWSFIPLTSRTSSFLTRAVRGSSSPDTNRRAGASRRPRPNKQ